MMKAPQGRSRGWKIVRSDVTERGASRDSRIEQFEKSIKNNVKRMIEQNSARNGKNSLQNQETSDHEHGFDHVSFNRCKRQPHHPL